MAKHTPTANRLRRFLAKRSFDLLAVLIIAALSLATTYPWIAAPRETSIGLVEQSTGFPSTDCMRSLALSGWLRFGPAELGEPALGNSPYLMYPTGASHARSVDGLLLGAVVALLACVLPLQLAWSIALVLAFFLSGLMLYRFAYRRFGRGLIALVLAASATLLPYIQQRAALHPNLCYVWVMPVAIHLLLNFERRPTPKRALAWACSFPLLALSSGYVMIAGLCFHACATLGLLIGWRAWRTPRFWREPRLRNLALGWVAGVGGIILAMFRMLLGARHHGAPDPNDMALYSVPLAQYVIPHPYSWLGHFPVFWNLWEKSGVNWEALAGGPLAAILLAPFFVLLRRAPGPRAVLGIALFGAFVLNSGPRLKFFYAGPDAFSIPMPLLALTELSPAINKIRHPGRMHPMFLYLALCATGYLLAWLRTRWTGKLWRWAGWPALAAAVLAANMLWSARFGHYLVYNTLKPHPYLEQIAAPPQTGTALPGAVMDIPASNYFFSHYNFEIFTHRRPIVYGEAGFFHDALTPEQLRFTKDDPQMRFFMAEWFTELADETKRQEIAAGLAGEAYLQKLAAAGVEYIVVHPVELAWLVRENRVPANLPDYYAWIEGAWQAHAVYADQHIRVYRTTPSR